MTILEEIQSLLVKAPKYVQKDVDKRINDWLFMGGDENSGYMKQQLIYIKRILKADDKNEIN